MLCPTRCNVQEFIEIVEFYCQFSTTSSNFSVQLLRNLNNHETMSRLKFKELKFSYGPVDIKNVLNPCLLLILLRL